MRFDLTEVGWKAFEKYKVSDDEYDFTNAALEDVENAYRLLMDDDEIQVVENN